MCLCVILSAYFKGVCVFSGQERTTERLTLFPIARVRDCLADSTPPRPLYQKFHACVRAARRQRVSISSSKLPSSEQRKLLPRLQIGRLGLSLHSSRTNLCALSGSLLKTFFFALSSRITSELLAGAGTVQNCILPFLFTHRLHQL